MKKIIFSVFTVVILCLGLTLVACADIDEDSGSNSSKNYSTESAGDMNSAIIYSEHSNTTKGTKGLEKYIRGAKEGSGYLAFIGLDGKPFIQKQEKEENSKGDERRVKKENNSFVNQNMEELESIKAKSDEVDILKSFEKAGEAFKKNINKDLPNVVVFVGNGISTKGDINFTENSLESLDLNNYESWLEKNTTIPDLKNVNKVIWYNFDKVSDPQMEFPGGTFNNNLQEFYTKLLKKAGVKEIVFEGSLDEENAPSSGLPKVTSVKLPPKPKYGAGDSAQISADVLFKPGTSQFSGDPASNDQVKEIVNSMKSSDLCVTITGYTANYQTNDEGGNDKLAKNRAEAMKNVLVNLGCSADRITTEGVGHGWKEGTGDDVDADNRCVKFDFKK